MTWLARMHACTLYTQWVQFVDNLLLILNIIWIMWFCSGCHNGFSFKMDRFDPMDYTAVLRKILHITTVWFNSIDEFITHRLEPMNILQFDRFIRSRIYELIYTFLWNKLHSIARCSVVHCIEIHPYTAYIWRQLQSMSNQLSTQVKLIKH